MRPSRVILTLAATAGLAAVLPAQALAAGSLSVSPAIVEHVATTGNVGRVTIANTTGAPLKITVAARPWIQSRATGVVSADRRRTLASQVAVSSRSFTLASGVNRSVSLTLRRTPAGRALYGAIEVVGLPTKKPKRGIAAGYRIVSSLRLNAPKAAQRLRLQAGIPRTVGSGSSRQLKLGVRNTGNTIDPITGTATIAGARGTRRVTLGARRILPGAIVDVALTRIAGLAKGTYKVTTVLRQGGRTVLSSKRSVRIG